MRDEPAIGSGGSVRRPLRVDAMSGVFSAGRGSGRPTGDSPRRNAWIAWWGQLAPRERGLMILGVAVLVFVAGYMLLWEPAARGIRRLEADLPQLRAQSASLRAMADEARQLRAAMGQAAPIAPADRVAAVRRSLERAGLSRGEPVKGTAIGAGAVTSDSASRGSAPVLSIGGADASGAAPGARLSPPDVAPEANGRVRVRFADIDYGVWIAWLATTETELGARSTHASVAALAPNGPVGHVRTEVVLDWTAPVAVPAASTTPASRP